MERPKLMTSYAGAITGPLFLILLLLHLRSGGGGGVVWTVGFVFLLSQLAFWFKGVFRAVFGALMLMFGGWTGLIVISECLFGRFGSVGERLMCLLLGLGLAALPLLFRKELYVDRAGAEDSLKETL